MDWSKTTGGRAGVSKMGQKRLGNRNDERDERDESYISEDRNYQVLIPPVLFRTVYIYIWRIDIQSLGEAKRQEYFRTIYCSAALFLLTSLSSEMVSLVPLPLGKDIQGLIPSPMTKMLVTLQDNVSLLE